MFIAKYMFILKRSKKKEAPELLKTFEEFILTIEEANVEELYEIISIYGDCLCQSELEECQSELVKCQSELVKCQSELVEDPS